MCRRTVLLTATVVLHILGSMSQGKQMLINVNLDTTERAESTLDGPLDGDGGMDVGTTWNQILRGPGRSWTIDGVDLQDSTGAATTVNFRVTSEGTLGCWEWGTPDLTLLTSAITGWDPDVDAYDLIFSGIPAGTKYDLYLASFHPNENGGRALFATDNATRTESPQVVDNGGGGGNDSTWVQDENYVLFEKVAVDGNGEIIIHVYSDWTTDNTKRAYVSGIQLLTSSMPGLASLPAPEEEAADVPRDVTLAWTPGEYAVKHNVYLGTSFADVNSASTAALVGDGLDVNSLDMGALAFGQTYYWRVDEVNGAPDYSVLTGEIWSFTVEPFSIPIEQVTATASSSQAADMGPENTINGVGLNALDQHSTEATEMWLSGMGDAAPWIQYEFDQAYKLHEMWVWNSNQRIESFVGLGAKDVVIETSLDGAEWVALAGPVQFAQAPGAADYVANTTVDFGGVMAKYVRISAQSGFGLLPQYGLSEVRFFSIPVWAREPQPEDGIIMDNGAVTLKWRAGREAVTHEVYLGTDSEDLSLVATVADNRLDLNDQGLTYGTTYFWQINEVNDAAVPPAHAGPVWSFTLPDFAVIDDFDQYDDNCNRIFFIWLDGFGHNGSEACGVAPYNGNGTGSIVGNAEAPFAEQTIVRAGQSMPFGYDNTTESRSEISVDTANLDLGQDWSAGGPTTLVLWVLGNPDNAATDRLYLKIDNAKVIYDGDLAQTAWTQWNIDLDSLNADLAHVQTLTLGVERIGAGGGTGTLYIEDMRLYRTPPGAEEAVSLVEDFDGLAVGTNMQDVDGWEGWEGDPRWGARVTDAVAYSGTHSLEIVGTRDDLVPNWPAVDLGTYILTVMQYVPGTTNGQMYFWVYGAGTILSNCDTGFVYVNDLDAGVRTETPLIRDQWVELRIVMNLDIKTCDFYYGDVLLGTRACSSPDGVDIWPNDDVEVIYFDDFRFQSQSDYALGMPIAVPNGDFEEIYKPGTTIMADLGDGWTQGLGPDAPMDSGTATYFDGTSGDAVDIPGWIGADARGWVDNGGTYDRDTGFPNRQGSVARQTETPDGLYYFLSNGGAWGNAAGGLIESENPVATLTSGRTYVLSMLAHGGATPIVLELLADGVPLTPSDSVDPALSADWQTFSRTYDAAALEGLAGAALTIRLGVGRSASGSQSHFDAVSLYMR